VSEKTNKFNDSLRIATPLSQRTFTAYASPVSRRTVPVMPCAANLVMFIRMNYF
jgi:hypothetical protein